MDPDEKITMRSSRSKLQLAGPNVVSCETSTHSHLTTKPLEDEEDRRDGKRNDPRPEGKPKPDGKTKPEAKPRPANRKRRAGRRMKTVPRKRARYILYTKKRRYAPKNDRKEKAVKEEKYVSSSSSEADAIASISSPSSESGSSY